MEPVVRVIPSAILSLAAAFAVSTAAAAETDFLAVKKVSCTPDTITRCDAEKKCTTRPASARDKSEALVVDFAAKTASVRKEGKLQLFADVIEDKVEGEQRRLVMTEAGKSGAGDKLEATLSKSGKLTLAVGRNGGKAEASCAEEP